MKRNSFTTDSNVSINFKLTISESVKDTSSFDSWQIILFYNWIHAYFFGNKLLAKRTNTQDGVKYLCSWKTSTLFVNCDCKPFSINRKWRTEVIDHPTSVLVRLPDHLVHFLVRQLLPHVGHNVTQLRRTDHAWNNGCRPLNNQ